MTVNYTTLLGLAQPVTGTEANTWGDVVNDEITALIEEAIAGGETIDVTANNVTLTDTDGAANQARNAILLITGTPGTTRNVVAPSTSKVYIVRNGSNGAIVLKGSATTGVTIPAGGDALCFWNGSDFEIGTTFTTILDVDNLRLDGNTISSTDTNGNIVLAPNGTGDVQVDADTLRVGDSNANATITTNGTGDLILNTNAGTNSGSITIEDAANGNIIIAPNGTGDVQVDADTLRVGDSGSDATIQSNGNADLILKTGNSTTGSVTLADGANGSLTVALNGTGQVIVNAGAVGTPAITTTGDTNTGIFFPAADTIAFAEGGAEAMRIDSDGDVGIGTTAPAAKLHIKGAGSYDGVIRVDNSSTTGGGTFSVAQNGSTVGYLTTNGVAQGDTGADLALYSETGKVITFFTNGSNTERARITSGGNLLVGTTTAFALSSASVTAGKFGATNNNAASANLQCWNQATSGNNNFIDFYTEGGGGSIRGNIDYNRAAGLVRYNTSSDATLKNIIGDSDGEKSVEILNSTRIREFAWKDDETQKPQIGVIAQELHETFKGAVSVGGDYEVTIPAVTEQRLVSEAVLDEDGNEIEAAVYETVEVEPERTETKYRPWAVDKTAFTFHLVAGWQAHEKIIKQQADMIAALEARIAALEQA